MEEPRVQSIQASQILRFLQDVASTESAVSTSTQSDANNVITTSEPNNASVLPSSPLHEMIDSEEPPPFVAGYLCGLSHAHRQALSHVERNGVVAAATRRCEADIAELSRRMATTEATVATGQGMVHGLRQKVSEMERFERSTQRILWMMVGKVDSLAAQTNAIREQAGPISMALLKTTFRWLMSGVRLSSSTLPKLAFGVSQRDITLKGLLQWSAFMSWSEAMAKVKSLPLPAKKLVNVLRFVVWWCACSTLARAAFAWRSKLLLEQQNGDTPADTVTDSVSAIDRDGVADVSQTETESRDSRGPADVDGENTA